MREKLRSLKLIISLMVVGIFSVIIIVLTVFDHDRAAGQLEETYKQEYVKMATQVGTEMEDMIKRQVLFAEAMAKDPTIRRAVGSGNFTLANPMLTNLFNTMGF